MAKVITLKMGEPIFIGPDIRVVVYDRPQERSNWVRVAINCPKELLISSPAIKTKLCLSCREPVYRCECVGPIR